MLKSNSSIISIIVPRFILAKITQLLQELIEADEIDGVYVSDNENHLQVTINNKNNSSNFSGFQLFVAPEIQVLLLIEKKFDNLFFQISLLFETSEILDFIELSQDYFPLSVSDRHKLNSILTSPDCQLNTQHYFFIILTKILTEYLTVEDESIVDNYHSQPIEILIKNTIAQEKILHEITHQIQQDVDPLVIVEKTIKQVQALLQIDRVLIYQLNYPCKDDDTTEEILIDTVTYEAKSDDKKISSVLNYSDDHCFQKSDDCLHKYMEEFCLVIDNINQYNLDNCLKEVMKTLGVKAKISIPIIVKNQLWGLLIGHQCSGSRKWKDSEINFLKNIAEYLSLAIYQHKSAEKVKTQKQKLEEEIENKAKQLQDALIVAQIAHQSKTEFLGSISHELRTPLTCVIGLSGTLLYWLKDPNEQTLSLEKRVRYLQMIQDSGRKLLQLINNVLDFADLEAGKSLLNITNFSLENLAKTIELAGEEIASPQGVNIVLEYEIDEELDLFNADEERVYQILFNLVDNAIKFTPEGGKVQIRFRRHQSQVLFQIQDTGIGINKEQIPLLFTQFKQLENYRNRSYPGTGLGLALTKHLVELHGGIIDVESSIGQGSTFTVSLPDSQLKEKNIITEIIPINQEIKMNKTIVIICKDEEIGTFLCELLTAADYQIIWLLDEQEAITRIRLIQPAIVILEEEDQVCLQMTKRIRSNVRIPIHLMIIKDKMSNQQWIDLQHAGVNEYLLKPLQPRVMLNKVSNIIYQNIIQA